MRFGPFLCILCIAVAGTILAPNEVSSYAIRSGFTDACHESMTADAVTAILEQGEFIPGVSVPVPTGDVWLAVYKLLDGTLDLEQAAAEDRFLVLSLVLGSRHPDLAGESVSNLHNLHNIHDDPEGQYYHCLRNATDDYEEGNVSALSGTIATIQLELALAASFMEKPPGEQIIKIPYYDDYYGILNVEVWAPAFHLGIATHIVQDSFSHTVRTDDLHKIRHIGNYVDAAGHDYNPERDGLAHSVAMDDCYGAAAEICLYGTEPATRAFFEAFIAHHGADDPNRLAVFIDDWLTYEPGCSMDNDFCDSIWASIARKDPSEPYVSCAYSSTPSSGLALWLLALLVLFLARNFRTRQNTGDWSST